MKRNLNCGGYVKSIKFVEVDKSSASGAKPGVRAGVKRRSDSKSKESERPLLETAVQPVHHDYSNDRDSSSKASEPQMPSPSRSVQADRLSTPLLGEKNAGTTAAAETPVVYTECLSSDLESDPPGLHLDIFDLLFPRSPTPAAVADPAAMPRSAIGEPTLSSRASADASIRVGAGLPNFHHFMLDVDEMENAFDPSFLAGCGQEDALPGSPEAHPQPDLQMSASASQHASFNPLPAPFPLYQHPPMTNDSPETIAVVFDRRICEVLCIKDGAAGNPWRLIIWPLAKEHSAVYHAVAAMTYFQWSNTLPQVRVRGMQHLQASIDILAATPSHTMPLKVSLTARLLLAFAESWYYPRSSCGSQHIREAKRLLETALHKATAPGEMQIHIDAQQALPLQFLAKTWVYMDVLTRITCDTVEDLDIDFVAKCGDNTGEAYINDHIDPLMGCAEPLFPMLGRVADLVRGVRKRMTKPNSPAMVARAVDLKKSIENWSPWAREECDATNPDKEALTPVDSDIVQTAYAYKWAALLLLCQAVPELPSRFSYESIAQKILTVIATVPAESKASIFHIFPLMVAGCDTTDADDRDWIRDRWQRLLAGGNSSGISERCLELTSEVWARRDSYKAQQNGKNKSIVTYKG